MEPPYNPMEVRVSGTDKQEFFKPDDVEVDPYDHHLWLLPLALKYQVAPYRLTI